METSTQYETIHHSQSLETIGLMASGIAHDFNNLLTNIMGQSALALEVLPADNEAREYIENVMRAADTAAQLTRQLLNFANDSTLRVETFDLNELVRNSAQLLHMSLTDKVSLEIDLQPDISPITAVSLQIQQVLMSLVINAVEAFDEERGLIVIRTGEYAPQTNGLANGRLPHNSSYLFLQVEDNGCGMDEKVATKIFEPFFSTKQRGSGMGLATVQQIVKQHHGAITLSSNPDTGTKFTVILPAVTEKVACHSTR